MTFPDELPVLDTARLRLRPWRLTDAGRVRELAGDRAIAAMTLRVPHPYEAGMAEDWIAAHRPAFERGELLALAMTELSTGAVVGALGMDLNFEHFRGNLGYWVGRAYWGQGYCTEAARALLDYAFHTLGINKVESECLTRNAASARVLQKLGLRSEGMRRQRYLKWGRFEDVEQFGLLKVDYE